MSISAITLLSYSELIFGKIIKPILFFDLWEICFYLIFFHTNQGFKLFRHSIFVVCKPQGFYEKRKYKNFNFKEF